MTKGDQVEVVYYRSQRMRCSLGAICPDLQISPCKHQRILGPYGSTEVKLFVNQRGRSRFAKAQEYCDDHPELWTERSSEMLL